MWQNIKEKFMSNQQTFFVKFVKKDLLDLEILRNINWHIQENNHSIIRTRKKHSEEEYYSF